MRSGESARLEQFGYAAVEQAIAAILQIPKSKRVALRGRLQHLRSLGTPKLPKSGSGKKIAFSFADAFEILVALRLERINCSPKIASRGAKVGRKAFEAAVPSAPLLIFLPGDGFVAVTPDFLTTNATELGEGAWVNLWLSQRELLGALVDTVE
jgi:hypothetical protein